MCTHSHWAIHEWRLIYSWGLTSVTIVYWVLASNTCPRDTGEYWHSLYTSSGWMENFFLLLGNYLLHPSETQEQNDSCSKSEMVHPEYFASAISLTVLPNAHHTLNCIQHFSGNARTIWLWCGNDWFYWMLQIMVLPFSEPSGNVNHPSKAKSHVS